MVRQSRRFHSHRLRIGRRSQVGHAYLVTTVTRHRVPVFQDWYKACACARVLHSMPGKVSVQSLAWAVMPDHLHWLFLLKEETLAGVVRTLKAHSAHAVNAVDGSRGSLWQPGYHDHAVRREEDLRAVARYLIANPVRAGLCESVGDYPFWDAVWVEGGDANDLPDDLVAAE